MYNYELTERGKIVIAVLLVLLLLLVPSAILLYNAMISQPPQPTENKDPDELKSPPPITVITPPPEIKESPPPEGGGLSPSDVEPSPDDGGGGEEEQEPPKTPEFGPTGGNPSQGTLSFLFSPDEQTMLDDETLSMMEELIKSPHNTDFNLIAIEIPQLSGENADKFFFAVVSAFTDLGIQEQRLAYVAHPSEAVEGAFEVQVYYIQTSIK